MLEKARLNYEISVLSLLKKIQNAYWESDGDYIKLTTHEKQHSPPLRVGVMFSGGPASGGLNVIWGLYKGLQDIHPDCQLIGFMNGASGLLEDQTLEIKKEHIEEIKNQGGFTLIGTGRTKIESTDQKEKALETIKKHKLQGLVFIGGDDTNTNAYHLSEYFEQNNARCTVVGIPKTIDGDLKNEHIEASFGFDTATKTFSNMIGNLGKDSMSAKKYWFFVKLMGRSASHVTLECAMKTKPNLAFISEEIKEKAVTLKEIIDICTDTVIERAKIKKNYGVILIPEGLVEACPDVKELIDECNRLNKENKIADHLSQKNKVLFDTLPKEIQIQIFSDLDPHGNIQLSHIATDKLLIEMVKERLKGKEEVTFNGVGIFYGYDGRCCLPSNFDATYCYNLGLLSALLVRDRKTGYMACIKNLSLPIIDWVGAGISIKSMMTEEVRGGEKKEVIAKSLVDLKDKPFKFCAKERKQWRLNDYYESPGPMQFDDTANKGFLVTDTLLLEKKKKKFFKIV